MANVSDSGPVADDELEALFQPLSQSTGLVLAVSGGVDSTALMHLFARWAKNRPQFPRTLVVTVDHGLRPAAADEARLVATQTEALGLRHATLYWSGEKPTSDIQDAARTARYRLLAEAARLERADTIVTAHTLEDQAETFLLALARGSGVYGLSSMPRERRLGGIRLVRPFLSLSKARLIATLTAEGIGWSEDPSNANDRFRRVVLRKAQPMLAGLGLSTMTLADTAGRLARAASALDHYADRLIARAVLIHPGGYLDVDARQLVSEPEEVTLRALARMLKAITGQNHGPRLDRLERLLGEIDASQAAGVALRRTLAGVTVHLSAARDGSRPRLWLFAEAGRQGFDDMPLAPGQTIDWVGRVRISLSPAAPEPLTIRALGGAARRVLGPLAPVGVPAPALATLPTVWRRDNLVAVLGLSTDLVQAGGAIRASALVGERLAATGS